jgi:hypothetical protein
MPRLGSTSVSERAAQIVVVIASGWFAFTAFWGLFGILGGGHLGAGSVGNVMAAEQIVRWHIWYPAWDWYLGKAPDQANYICHHPFGQYYVPAIFLWIFGHHDFVARLPASLMCAAVPPLLYGIGKEKWGPTSGAVAAAGYVVVPVALGFSNFTNLENFVIFGTLLFFWGHSRHATTRKRRYLVASLVGLLFACSGDWAGYLMVAPTIIWTFLHAFVLPARLMPRIHFPSYARWWGLSVGIVAATLLYWLVMFAKADQITQWVLSAAGRGGAEGTKLKDVLESRQYWIDFSFTPLAIKLGKLAAPLCLLRLFLTREDEESYSLSFLFGATVQYVVFKQGADIHIFWSIYFAPYYALALAQLAHSVGASCGWLVGRLAPAARRPTVAWVTLALGILPPLAMAHDGIESLWVWRRTGGRYDDNGSLIRNSIDLMSVVEQVIMPQTERGSSIDTNPTSGWGWEHQWKWQGPNNDVGLPQAGSRAVASHPFWIGRGSGMMADVQKKVVAAAHVRIYGDTWIVDQRQPAAPLDAYDLEETEPGFFRWLLYDGTEPERHVSSQPDPWLTWEYRTHLGQGAFEPTATPVTLEQMRIAHNVAVSKNDAVTAEKWREKIDEQINRTVTVKYEPWVRLIGVRLIGGVQPRLETWFEVTAEPAGDAQFNVASTIVGKAKYSLIPVDKTDREVAFPPLLPTKLWKVGYLYDTVTVLNHRIGREKYVGGWASRDGSTPPRRPDNKPDTTLCIVE